MYSNQGWIGVDFDGCLAEYYGYDPSGKLGKPVPAMLQRVLNWLAEGKDVRIFTARGSIDEADRAKSYPAIRSWCLEHIGQELPITNVKDIWMIELWDDRAVQVERNTGRRIGDVEVQQRAQA